MEQKSNEGYRRVLIVDDNPAIVKVLATRLLMQGWDCMTALNGHDAMCLLNEHTTDAIITDLDMPYVDGFGVLEIAESFIGRPAIAITGSDESEARCKRDFPRVPLIKKPFDSMELLGALNATCLIFKPNVA